MLKDIKDVLLQEHEAFLRISAKITEVHDKVPRIFYLIWLTPER